MLNNLLDKSSVSAFDEYTCLLRDLAEKSQDKEREHISEEVAIMAAYCVKNMVLISEYDVVLCLAAYNVCNVYVKQYDRNPYFTYHFKRHIGSLMCSVASSGMHLIKFDFQTDKGMNVMIVQAGNIQFSFHQVSLSNSIIQEMSANALVSNLPWDQIYKQNCAQSLFCAALACEYNTNRTIRGKDLGRKLERQLSNYRNGRLNVAELFSFQ